MTLRVIAFHVSASLLNQFAISPFKRECAARIEGHKIETSASFPEASSLCRRKTLSSVRPARRSLFLATREGRTSADTLINGLGHAIPRDPFEKLRTIDLARFRNEGCILTASLSPCTERSNDAGVVSVCPLTPRRRERKGDRRVPRANGTAGAAAGESGSVHRWLRLPRWMYKGGLGSRECSYTCRRQIPRVAPLMTTLRIFEEPNWKNRRRRGNDSSRCGVS